MRTAPSGTATLPRPGNDPGTTWARMRWPLCAALVLGLHAALLLRLTRTSTRDLVEPPAPPAVLIDLSDVPPAPATSAPPPPVPLQPPPEMPDPPMLPDLTALPRLPQAVAQVPLPAPRHLPPPRRLVPPRPMPRAAARPAAPAPEPAPDAAVPSQPSPAAVPAQVAAAAAPPRPNAIPSWQGQLVARLRRARAYPDDARMRGDTGTVLVSFAMDRFGHVLSVRVVRSSGLPSLDEAAVQTVHRAEPLPELPPEIPGAQYMVSVPISFTLH